MMESIHPLATHHLPAFITAPGETDILMGLSAVVLVLSVLGAGVFFLWLHSLPERMVHNRLQYDLVAVLALISLFTHIHAFWIAALLLAFVTVPDLSRFDILGPLHSIAKSLRSLANQKDMPLATAAPAGTASPAPAPNPSADSVTSKEGGKNA